MGKYMLYENIILKCDKLKYEYIIKKICNKLDKLSNEILDIDANFTYYNEDDYYIIHNKNKSYGNNRLDLNFRLYFNMYEDFGKKDFLYAYILWFSVNPKKIGIGTKIISKIIDILKTLTDIEFIIIHPKDKEIKNFWIKNNFIEYNNKIYSDKRVMVNTRRILSYHIKEN